jgi:hypothetical protein
MAARRKTITFSEQLFDKTPGFFGEGIGRNKQVRKKAEHITPRSDSQ